MKPIIIFFVFDAILALSWLVKKRLQPYRLQKLTQILYPVSFVGSKFVFLEEHYCDQGGCRLFLTNRHGLDVHRCISYQALPDMKNVAMHGVMRQLFRNSSVRLAGRSKKNQQGSHEHPVFQMSERHAQPATAFKERNSLLKSGRYFNECCAIEHPET